jgi:hypothetical protein
MFHVTSLSSLSLSRSSFLTNGYTHQPSPWTLSLVFQLGVFYYIKLEITTEKQRTKKKNDPRLGTSSSIDPEREIVAVLSLPTFFSISSQ